MPDTSRSRIETPPLHEAVFTDRELEAQTGVKTLDVAKRLIDYGFHPPTVYFPLVVRGALMIEPTETETKQTLDAFVDAMIAIKREAETEPGARCAAPRTSRASAASTKRAPLASRACAGRPKRLPTELSPRMISELPAAPVTNRSEGWLGRLELGFEDVLGTTRLVRRRHEGPLRVQRALFPEGRSLPHVILLHPPGGVVGGDRLELSIDLGPRARALLTTPAAQKLYRSAGPEAIQQNRLNLARDAELEWLPGETIAFDGAIVRTTTRVMLEAGSAFIGWEISCYGCPSSGIAFEHGRLEQRLEIFRRQEPLLIERTAVCAGTGVLAGPWALRGNPVLAALYAVPRGTGELGALVDLLRDHSRVDSGVTSAVTSLGEMLVVRASGTRVEQVRELLVASWRKLRPAILGRDAVTPRIWAT